jgi:hypothetical protein
MNVIQTSTMAQSVPAMIHQVGVGDCNAIMWRIVWPLAYDSQSCTWRAESSSSISEWIFVSFFVPASREKKNVNQGKAFTAVALEIGFYWIVYMI